MKKNKSEIEQLKDRLFQIEGALLALIEAVETGDKMMATEAYERMPR